MSLALPVGAVMNCADNTGARNLYVIAVVGFGARLNKLPAAAAGDMVMCSVKKGKPELRKKGLSPFSSSFPSPFLSALVAWTPLRGLARYRSPACSHTHTLQLCPQSSSANRSPGEGRTAPGSTSRTTPV